MAFLHFAGSVIGMLVAIYLVHRVDGAPAWSERLSLPKATAEGTRYAVGSLVGTSYQEVDKVLLLQILGATVAGTYTAAFRVMSVFVLPVAALMGAALPRLFAMHGTPGGTRLLKTVAVAALCYAVTASIVAATRVAVDALRFRTQLCNIHKIPADAFAVGLVFALHQSAAIALTASDRQGARVVVEALGLALVIGMDLWLLRSVGAGAAALVLLTAEVFMACGCWLMMRRRWRL